MRRKTAEEKYLDKVGKQRKELEEFAAHEIQWAGDLMLWYRVKKQDMPDDEYRACAFFRNREFLGKPGSLTLLYQTYLRFLGERPDVTRETAFDLLCYRYRMYSKVLQTGGYDAGTGC
jgi:hypothetical protein